MGVRSPADTLRSAGARGGARRHDAARLRLEKLGELAAPGCLLRVIVAAHVLAQNKDIRHSPLLRHRKQCRLKLLTILALVEFDCHVRLRHLLEERLRLRAVRAPGFGVNHHVVAGSSLLDSLLKILLASHEHRRGAPRKARSAQRLLRHAERLLRHAKRVDARREDGKQTAHNTIHRLFRVDLGLFRDVASRLYLDLNSTVESIRWLQCSYRTGQPRHPHHSSRATVGFIGPQNRTSESDLVARRTRPVASLTVAQPEPRPHVALATVQLRERKKHRFTVAQCPGAAGAGAADHAAGAAGSEVEDPRCE